MTTTIHSPPFTATIESGTPEEIGGMCYANHNITLEICGKKHELSCWHLCGFLAPGASGDLDGSGLSLWGNSQPGGWRTCDNDGQSRGFIKVDYDSDIGILIDTPDNRFIIDVKELFPGLSENIQSELISDFDDSKEKYDVLVAQLLDGLSLLTKKIDKEITNLYESAEPSEPNAEDVYLNLSDIRNLEDINVRVGDYEGAGPCVAWRDERNEYHFISHPDESDVEDIVKKVKYNIFDSIMHELNKNN